MGNENGNGPKLGSMDLEEGVQVHSAGATQRISSLESYATVGDITNASKHRKKNIPEVVKLEKKLFKRLSLVHVSK